MKTSSKKWGWVFGCAALLATAGFVGCGDSTGDSDGSDSDGSDGNGGNSGTTGGNTTGSSCSTNSLCNNGVCNCGVDGSGAACCDPSDPECEGASNICNGSFCEVCE